jgi:hypothetical protein
MSDSDTTNVRYRTKKTALHCRAAKIFAQGFNLLQTVFSIGIGYWSFGSWIVIGFSGQGWRLISLDLDN